MSELGSGAATSPAVAYLRHAFEPGARLRCGAQVAEAQTIEVAALNLPTGAVVVADPFVQPDAPALSPRVAPGRYPVLLSLLHEPDKYFNTVVAAMLRLADGAAVTWAPAMSAGQIAGLYPAGCRVHSGTAAYMSLDSARLFASELAMLGTVNMGLIERLSQVMAVHSLKAQAAWADVDLDGDVNVVMFEAGRGEGQYASYWGYDADGLLVSLVTDFGVLSSPEE